MGLVFEESQGRGGRQVTFSQVARFSVNNPKDGMEEVDLKACFGIHKESLDVNSSWSARRGVDKQPYPICLITVRRLRKVPQG